MNTTRSIDLISYGLMVAVLYLAADRIAPDFAGSTLRVLVAGGLFVMLLGVLGLCGFRTRTWSIVTLTIFAVWLLIQAAKACCALTAGVVGSKPVAMILSLLLVFTIGQLLALAHSGRHWRIKFGKATDGATNHSDMEDDSKQRTRRAFDE